VIETRNTVDSVDNKPHAMSATGKRTTRTILCPRSVYAPVEHLADVATALQAAESIQHVHVHDVQQVVLQQAGVLLDRDHTLCKYDSTWSTEAQRSRS